MLKHQRMTAISDNIVNKSRKQRNAELVQATREVCEKLGGMAEIGEGYVVVDTKKFKVEMK